MHRASRKQWLDRAERVALEKLRDLSLTEQNEFWLKHAPLFLPFSSMERIMQFCGVQHLLYSPDPYLCESCDSDNLMEDEAHNDTICAECGLVQPWPVACFKRKLQEGQEFIRKKGYAPEDHMSCILTEMQCGRSRDMEDILEDVSHYLKQRHIDVTYMSVRGSLRKLGYKQHYLMLPSILHGLDRAQFRPWILPRGALKNIQALFFQYKLLFDRLSLEEKEFRKNSLNYHYLLVQFCQMLGLTIPRQFLRTPQGVKSIQQHDRIWKKIQPLLIMH